MHYDLTKQKSTEIIMLLRLSRENFKQVIGPTTRKQYTFVRRAGSDGRLEVDDADGEQLLRQTSGCCGKRYKSFEKIEEQA